MRSIKEIEKSIKKLAVESSDQIQDRILQKLLKKLERSNKQTTAKQTSVWRIMLWYRVAYLAAAFLIISSFTACFVLYREVTDLKKEVAYLNTTIANTDDLVTINFYLKEHQDAVFQKASLSPATLKPLQIQVNQNDILYYENFNIWPEFIRPGIIIKSPSSQQQINSSETPVISNGHELTLSEAQETINFDLVSPSWLYSGYILDQIRKIEDHDTIQLLYTDGINSVSLFEQSLDSHRILEPQDFREYVVYRNKGQAGGTILAWTNNSLSYVLIGSIEISQLMNMAQSINAENKEK